MCITYPYKFNGEWHFDFGLDLWIDIFFDEVDRNDCNGGEYQRRKVSRRDVTEEINVSLKQKKTLFHGFHLYVYV